MTTPGDPDQALRRFSIDCPRLFDGDRMRGPTRLLVEDGYIASMSGPTGDSSTPVVRLPADCLLAPGFIDVQVNGGGGVLLNDVPTAFAVRRMVEAHRRHGTTGMLPTLITDGADKMAALLAAATDARAVAGVLGFHLEGPHISLARKGIHPPSHIRPMSAEDRARLAAFGAHGRSQVTLAPECVAPEDVAALVAAGLRVSIGHSDADVHTVARAVAAGATGVTHLYNAMSQLVSRAPGVVGATLADDRLTAGIICDGLHVDPVALSVAYKAKGRSGLMLVSDAMSSIGATSDTFQLNGRTIRLVDGRLTDEAGTLAGAHLGMIEAVRNAVTMMGAPLRDALIMASTTPARFLGLDGERGRIAPGYRADLVAFTSAFEVVETWIAGAGTPRRT
ncbi:N-acetylglucosamine-6-phosphate deacetylase [uncultured Alsobacter sp.]|uniref:N-acetylglucosamine-6-phosphate deacetylase n=1 Tax=uncultured Alsobacter sp. TaxID=1748258 RepID=UPI0025FFE8A7|nr:N-acetylglucosamine-6-phosphate deacetylase [uncultured Alsobacter sp.]